MERVLPLVARHGAAVVAITNDETGISEDPDVRFEVARKIVSRAEDHGIPPRGRRRRPARDADRRDGHRGTPGLPAARAGFGTSCGVNSTCGASNVSFGLPNRTGLNAAFLPMAIASGLTSAITSPLHAEMLQASEGRRRADGQRRALRRVDRAKRGRRVGRDCGASRRTGRSEGDG